MKRIILAATLALSAVAASSVFADTQMADCKHQCKMAMQHCKTLAKHSDARKECFKKAKADKKACKMNMKKPAALNQQQPQNNNPQTASNTPAPAAAPQQPATAQ